MLESFRIGDVFQRGRRFEAYYIILRLLGSAGEAYFLLSICQAVHA